MLKFNVDAAMNELANILESELEIALNAWEIEVNSKIRNNYYSQYAKVDHEIKKQTKGLIAYLKANTAVLADSYGTGSLMLDDNPGLAEYKADKDRWNPERHGKAIVGRHEGQYTNIISGKPRKTSGTFAGINIEGKRVYTKKNEEENDYNISPTHPSYAIQLAEQYLYKQWLPIAFKNAVNRLNLAKFLIES